MQDFAVELWNWLYSNRIWIIGVIGVFAWFSWYSICRAIAERHCADRDKEKFVKYVQEKGVINDYIRPVTEYDECFEGYCGCLFFGVPSLIIFIVALVFATLTSPQ